MPKTYLKRSTACVALLAGAIGTGEAQQRRPAEPQKLAVTVVNRASATLNNLYITPVAQVGWGEDRLGSDTLSTTSRQRITVDRAPGCRYDIRAVYGNGKVDVEADLDLCAAGTVTLTGGKQVDLLRLVRYAARRPVGLFVVDNRTGTELTNLRAGEVNHLEGTTVDPGDQTVGRFRHADGCRINLVAELKDGDALFVAGHDLCLNPRIALAQPERMESVRFRNRSAYPLVNLYVRPVGFDVWGSDRLGSGTVQPRDMKTLKVAGQGGACLYDVKASFSGADDEVRSGIDLCAGKIIDIEGPELVTGKGDKKETAAPAETREPLAITLSNESVRTIREVFISPASTKDWGDNRIARPLARGASAPLGIEQGESCLFDVKAVFEGGREQRRMSLDLCRNTAVAIGGTLTNLVDGGGPETGFPARFLNAGRVQVQSIYLTPSSDSHWGEDRLGSNALERNSRLDLRLPRAGGCFWDVKVTFEGEPVQEMRRVNLCDAPEQRLRPRQKPGSVVSTGTGFYVTATGHVVTNSHVVEGCKVVQVARDGQPPLPLAILKQDADIDIAVLKADVSAASFIHLRSASGLPARTGERAIVVGYPVRSKLGVVNVTEGIVSSAASGGQDPARMQLTAPVQPGNSGGPILDGAGRAIGVVVSRLGQLDDERMTQNVNFGVSMAAVESFLKEAGITLPAPAADSPAERGTPEVFAGANPAVLPLDCLE